MKKPDNVPEPGDDEFWALVELANKDFAAFTEKLEAMSREELIGFAWKFEDLAGFLYEPEYHQNRFSEDYLEDLSAWIVSRGREFYEKVRANPEDMPTEVNYSEPVLDIQYKASQVYHERFGEHMPPLEG